MGGWALITCWGFPDLCNCITQKSGHAAGREVDELLGKSMSARAI